MRTTIDLPDDVHRIVSAVARDRGTTLSQTVAQILRDTIGGVGPSTVRVDRRTGLPVVDLGHPISTEDVRSLEDEP